MYQLVADHYADPGKRLTPYRVLWATHGTRRDQSLGQEALRRLAANLDPILMPFSAFVASLTSSIFPVPKSDWKPVTAIFGKEHCDEEHIDYGDQFRRAAQSAVTLVSQAHLPLVFNNVGNSMYKQLLQRVGLVVIDEDPVQALIYSLVDTNSKSPITQSYLQERQAAGAASNIEIALLNVMVQAQSGDLDASCQKIPNGRTKQTLFNLSGEAFWNALRRELGTAIPDYTAFAKSLQAAVQAQERVLPKEFIETFQEDFKDSRNTSARFGITWLKGHDGTVHQMQFRGDVLLRLPATTPPIVILDAYANQELAQYERMFPNHTVKYLQEWPFTPLDIEYVPEQGGDSLEIDRENLTKNRQLDLRNYLMAETGALTRGHQAGTLILSSKAVVEYLKDDTKVPQAEWSWRDAYAQPELPSEAIQGMWWFSGRGVNEFDGRHVVAWHSPIRPKTYELHTLTALEPHSHEQRAALRQHAYQSELLQMCHRGRQTNYPEGSPERGRVVLFFDPGLLPKEWAQLRAFVPRARFLRGSNNPMHRHAVQQVATELYDLLGGLPHACLVGLGFYKPTPQDEAAWAIFKTKLRKRLKRLKLKTRHAPHLAAWAEDENALQHRLGQFAPADGSRPSKVLAHLEDADGGRLKGLHKFDVALPKTIGTKTSVYAKSQVEADQVLKRLLR
ncbi:hypothetical protein ACFSR9_01270 [Deinococcus taklimakanensis]|uniref:Uncharacterized protein n=1 Tax=Deinococcus taklimakanensis TaxID=536443 RepID=A0ABW5NZH7_9DEIO